MKINTTAEITKSILESKAYRGIDPLLVESIVLHESRNSEKAKEIEKRAKAHLHKIYTAFNKPVNFEKVFSKLRQAYKSHDMQTAREVLLQAMQAHSSSGERIPILSEFYEQIFAITGIPTSIIDVACGLNPLSIVYLDFPRTIEFHAYDIGSKEVGFLNDVFALTGYDQAHAEVSNLVETIPSVHADIAFLLKTIITIEAQEKGRAIQVIEAINAKKVVVSFPTFNLGIIKNAKGRKENYEKMFNEMIAGKSWAVDRLEFDSELVFIINKG